MNLIGASFAALGVGLVATIELMCTPERGTGQLVLVAVGGIGLALSLVLAVVAILTMFPIQ